MSEFAISRRSSIVTCLQTQRCGSTSQASPAWTLSPHSRATLPFRSQRTRWNRVLGYSSEEKTKAAWSVWEADVTRL